MMRASLFFFLVAGTVVATGCGDKKNLHTVEGTVTIDGQPLEGATVTFLSGDGTVASGLTTASGKFRLLTAGVEGVPAGTYKVSVTKAPKPSAAVTEEPDPTKAYTALMKESGAKFGKGGLEFPKPKSEVPERYTKPGGFPDQPVPASSPITLEMKSK